MNLKLYFLIVIISFLHSDIFGQKINFYSGLYKSGYFKSDKGRLFGVGISLDLSQTQGLEIGTKYNHFYYFTPKIQLFNYKRNSNAEHIHSELKYVHKLFENKLKIGAGIGLLTEAVSFPYEIYENNLPVGFEISQRHFTSLEFPLSVDYQIIQYKKLSLGIQMGAYIFPDYGFSGKYLTFNFAYNFQKE